MKKKIILVFVEAPIPFAGAASRWYYTLASGLCQSDYTVEIFASCATDSHLTEAQRIFPQGHFYNYPKNSSLKNKFKSIFKPFSYTIPDQMKKDFYAAVEKGYNVVHIEQIFASWILEKELPKSFVSVHYLVNVDLENVKFNNWKESLLIFLKKRAEIKLLSRFSVIKSCSLRIENVIKEWLPERKYIHFPFGIDHTQYTFLNDSERKPSKIITLIASMNWYPGKSAALRLLNEIWPELKKRNPDMQLRIVGWEARKELIDFLNVPDVEILENVPDIKKYFYESALLIYTPAKGSGVKIKIQEAMLLGTPVVTNEEGVEGLNVIHGKHAYVSNNNEEIISLTDQLFKNIDLQNQFRKEARSLIVETCNGKTIIDQVKQIYESFDE